MGLDDEKEFRATPIIRLELADLTRHVTLGSSIRLETVNHENQNTDYPDAVNDDQSLLARILCANVCAVRKIWCPRRDSNARPSA